MCLVTCIFWMHVSPIQEIADSSRFWLIFELRARRRQDTLTDIHCTVSVGWLITLFAAPTATLKPRDNVVLAAFATSPRVGFACQ